MSKVIAERITQSRELAGYSKSDVAEALGLSPAAIAQWENRTKTPTAENLESLSRFLRVNMALLMAPFPQQLLAKGPLTFRAQAGAKTRRSNRKAERLAELVAETYLWLENHVTLPEPSLPEVAFDGDIDAFADRCREAWGLGRRPLLKLGEFIESKGIVLARATFGDNRFDAFSVIVSGRPFIFLGCEKANRARSRFDAAHELGHLLMHQYLSDEELKTPEILKRIEKEANHFGGSFLMPAETFKNDVTSPTLDGFLKLKAKWGVSVQSMIFRARQLKIITEDHYSELYRQLSVKGWRTNEPLDEVVPEIRPSLGKRSLDVLEENAVLNAWELSTELPVPTYVLSQIFDRDPSLIEPKELGKIIPLKIFRPFNDQSAVG
jgi:Zn-dependent peptidase ImmA (M78 family)/DNA-binding XRE family transcriptional regulator